MRPAQVGSLDVAHDCLERYFLEQRRWGRCGGQGKGVRGRVGGGNRATGRLEGWHTNGTWYLVGQFVTAARHGGAVAKPGSETYGQYGSRCGYALAIGLCQPATLAHRWPPPAPAAACTGTRWAWPRWSCATSTCAGRTSRGGCWCRSAPRGSRCGGGGREGRAGGERWEFSVAGRSPMYGVRGYGVGRCLTDTSVPLLLSLFLPPRSAGQGAD